MPVLIHEDGMCMKRKMFAVGAPANADYESFICILKSKSEDQLTDD